jgi:hypothetical protein
MAKLQSHVTTSQKKKKKKKFKDLGMKISKNIIDLNKI